MKIGAIVAVAAAFLVGTAVPAVAAQSDGSLHLAGFRIVSKQAPVGGEVRVVGAYSNTSGEPITCVTQFGDGQSSTGPCDVRHAYGQPGSYQVTQTATIPSGESAGASGSLTVVEATGPTTVTASAVQAGDREVVISLGIDSDWDLGLGRVEWGDNAFTSGQADRLSGINHVYAEPGTYEIKVRVTDTSGYSAYTTTTVEIV